MTPKRDPTKHDGKKRDPKMCPRCRNVKSDGVPRYYVLLSNWQRLEQWCPDCNLFDVKEKPG